MPSTEHFAERIGAVFLPEADTIEVDQDFTPNPEGPFELPGLGLPTELLRERLRPRPQLLDPLINFRICATSLRSGCYTLSFVPSGTPLFGTRFRGTLRVENTGAGLRFSGDLYSYRLLDDIVVGWPPVALEAATFARRATAGDEAEDTGGTIPVYRRRAYHSYLKGTRARLISFVPRGAECRFTLELDQFVYNHPATGFSGSFNTTPTRAVRFVLRRTATPDVYTGEAFEGTTLLGTVSLRWVSSSFRRADLRIHTLEGAETPPAVGTNSFATIFADAGWELTVSDAGTIPLPAVLSGVNINACWSSVNLHRLMESVAGYNAADLDSVWRVHLVAVPAALGCSRGIMFDSGSGNPNTIAREGTATFSRDGYPANEVPDGMGGSHYDGAAGQQQRNVPRAFLRSAAHEVGHAFNQIHQGFEGGNDNSVMTPTPGVATVLGTGGTFPDGINLAFNDRVRKHLRHLPDPAVRPGAMNFFGSAISAPEAADVAWLDPLELELELSSDRVSLGEPLTLRFEIRNDGEAPIPVPTTLDVESLIVRVSVTDPAGTITFMRPPRVSSCPRIVIEPLEPGASVKGSTVVFWGTDGFAFETPGRHVVEVIVLWDIGGVPVAVDARADVFVAYPVTGQDNDVAALLLDPEVGAAIAAGELEGFERATERVAEAYERAEGHPAVESLRELGLVEREKGERERGPTQRGNG